MKEMTLPNSQISEEKKTYRTALERSLERWNFTLCVSAPLGALCGLAGVAIGTLSLTGLLSAHRRIDEIGTALLIFAFPLIILAAHCLDKAHEVEKAITIDYCSRTGMLDVGNKPKYNK